MCVNNYRPTLQPGQKKKNPKKKLMAHKKSAVAQKYVFVKIIVAPKKCNIAPKVCARL